ncbi:hypothetical protein A9G42_05265 [Gilliamella sp. Nev6-6]|uniref:hypothetical protein n=1 Tax=unclassified Gilliamella TaxID=2685620 RepID=UPI00080EA92A|nr:hypothetical protein [Gilliamella apicola]OCG58616.1 hypothetical protein A9G40_09055 [Gilliamella apicola]OCG77456.1 hypothetical protein A9G42_05265 [Gilliamella apicola]
MIKKVFYFFCIFTLAMPSFYNYAKNLENNTLIEFDGSGYRKDIRVYSLAPIDYIKDDPNFMFVSLSDDIKLYDEENKESVFLIPEGKRKNYKKKEYLLTDSYRAKFFSEVGISEDDTVFIYDYDQNYLKSFPINSLKVLAIVNPYKDADDGPFHLSDYMFGFKLDSKGLKDYSYSNLVYIGKENPFVQKPLTPLFWNKIDEKDSPVLDENDDITSLAFDGDLKDLKKVDSYLAQANGFRFFIKNYTIKNESALFHSGEIIARHLIILDSDSNIITNVIDGIMEGDMFYPLNNLNSKDEPIYQWTGKILKNEPPVVFGFKSSSFACTPVFQFMHPLHDYFVPRCDARH